MDGHGLGFIHGVSIVIILTYIVYVTHNQSASVLDDRGLGRLQEVLTLNTTSSSDFPFTIVTAASSNHFCSLEHYLYSLHAIRKQVPKDKFPRIVVYDIGLKAEQLPVMDQLVENGLVNDHHQLDFSRHPSFWNLRKNRGEYAWKTGIVNEVRQRIGGVIIWLDSGDVPNKNFILKVPLYIRKHGLWSPSSSGTMNAYTHQGMFNYFGANRKKYARKRNCNGAAFGFDSDNEIIVRDIIVPWYECGLDQNCIAPPESSRANHRQDQAAFTFLVYRADYLCTVHPQEYGVKVHEDGKCKQKLKKLDEAGELFHPSGIDPPNQAPKNSPGNALVEALAEEIDNVT
ncbi:hypothetical protein BZG36_03489 [Bifiguratus adelaidae]|uniref:Uncharacterized protein n=1 Tax=Bifiguratus adelaidae TaxID=1938954 RepID=A0A261XWQ4_9FUNG|nr:hypothetical protein BZG36_03489 [Bifiguratus adelaidae]